MFLKSEINLWLRESKMKSSYELEKDAMQFVQSKNVRKF